MHPAGPSVHVLDIESLRLSHEMTNGWDDKHRFGVAVCAILDVPTSAWHVFSEKPVAGCEDLRSLFEFVERCRALGCTLIGHNIVNFDWTVLAGEFEARGYVPDWRSYGPGRMRLVDTLLSLYQFLGYRPSLEQLAQHNLGESKAMMSHDAPTRWREGRLEEVVNYCKDDVEKTYKIWKIGREKGRVVVEKRWPEGERAVEVEW
ncbi:MAG TPA: hypothetical protein VM681_07355 [Candidatus Thermoplasmatota archaeon]|nr:hypothetical protein [Candidatus Thermoplasmatota archaeon]